MLASKFSWGTCNSDGRYKDRDFMKNVTFHTFPNPNINDDHNENTIKCREWIKACGRPADQLSLKKIHEDKIKKITTTKSVQR